MSRDGARTIFRRIVGLVLYLMAATLVISHQEPPVAPRPADADPAVFSAERAIDVLGSLLREDRPHGVGTEANRVVRDRVVDALEDLGLDPEVQRRWSCHHGRCARVENLVAVAPGADPDAEPVFLVAHYDSAYAGPGAADDGSGVAILLEIARIVTRGSPLPRPIGFLFTDGEEAGLLGARAFVEAHPLADDVAVVINLEARGTTGRSLLFQTSRPNRWLIAAFRRTAEHPSTSSLYAEVYQRLPNDTDFTVFSEDGTPGINLGFIDGLARYHTPQDDLDHLDRRSLQHQGDQALGLVQDLARLERLGGEPGENTVYSDLLGTVSAAHPEGLSLPLGILGGLGVLVLAGWARWRKDLHLGWTGASVVSLGVLAAFVLTVAAGLDFGLRQVGEWHGRPWPFRLGLWALGGAFATTHAGGLYRAGRGGVWTAIYGAFALLGVLTSVYVPGASYLFTWTVAFAVAGRAAGWGVREALVQGDPKKGREGRLRWIADGGELLGAIPGLVLWIQLAASLEWALDGFAILVLPPITISWMLLVGAWTGRARDHRLGAILWAAAFVLFSLTLTGMPSSETRPRQLTLHFVQTPSESRWIARAPEDAMGAIPGFHRPFRGFVPDNRHPLGLPLGTWAKDARTQRLPEPSLQVLEREGISTGRRLRVRLVSRRGAHSVGLRLPADSPIQRIEADGERLFPRRDGLLILHTDRPVELTLEIGDLDATKLTVFDISSELPDGAPPRGRYDLPTHTGDLSIVMGELRL